MEVEEAIPPEPGTMEATTQESVLEPEPELESEPEPEPKPQSEPEPEPALQPGSEPEPEFEPKDEFPRFVEAAERGFSVELGAGDALLIPRWWWHQSSALLDGHALNWWFELNTPEPTETEESKRTE